MAVGISSLEAFSYVLFEDGVSVGKIAGKKRC